METRNPLFIRPQDRIALVSGLRTPFARQATALHDVSPLEMAIPLVSELLARLNLDPTVIDQVVYGQVGKTPTLPNIAREIVLATPMSVATDAYSVSRACATSFQAVANVAESMLAQRVEVALAGGADSSSVPPIGVNRKMTKALINLSKARTFKEKCRAF